MQERLFGFIGFRKNASILKVVFIGFNFFQKHILKRLVNPFLILALGAINSKS